MCTKTPKVEKTPEKKPQYLRNPYLDNLTVKQSIQGRNSLRIDPGTSTPPLLTGIAPIRPPTIPSGVSTQGVVMNPGLGRFGIPTR